MSSTDVLATHDYRTVHESSSVTYVARRPRGSRSDRRNELRDKLLGAADELLAAGENLMTVSVDRLARAAGTTRHTFYRYFDGRGDLQLAWFTVLSDQLEAAADPFWTLDGPPSRTHLRDLLASIIDSYRPSARVMSSLYAAATLEPELNEAVQNAMSRSVAGLRRHIVDGQTHGWIAGNLPPKETAQWIMWMAESGLHDMNTRADNLDAVIDALTDVLFHGLYAPQDPSP